MNTVQFKPRRILLDPTSVCNLRCVQCHNATGLDPTYFVSMDRVDEIVKLSQDGLGILINVTGKGDILCHPQWREIIHRLDQGKHILTEFYTNALLFKDDDIDFCWSTDTLRVIHISIDAANAATYRNIRGADFDKLTAILKKLSSHPKSKAIRISMTLMKENFDQLEDFVDFAVEVGAHCVSYQAMFDRPYITINTPNGFTFNNDQVIHPNKMEERLIEAALYAKKKRIFVDTEQMDYLKRKYPIFFWHKYAFDVWLKQAIGVSFPERPEEEKQEIAGILKAKPACLRPWTELSHVEEGWRVCCMQHMDTRLGGENATLEEAWNSPEMQRIREQLARYECPPECDPVHCEVARALKS